MGTVASLLSAHSILYGNYPQGVRLLSRLTIDEASLTEARTVEIVE